MTAQAQSTSSQAPTLVVFGRDAAGKPHASSFTEAEAALAEKTAKLMSMSILPIRTEAERALAAKVPKGRVFGTGKAFVPFVKPALYVELQAASLKSGVTALKLVAAAQAGGTDDTTSPAPEGSAAEPTTSAKSSKGKRPSVPKQPCGWGDIEPGCLVLAALPPRYHDWFECVVIRVQGDRYTLRLADWPNEAPFVRRRVEIGLMHPAHTPEPPLDPEPPLKAA